MNKFKTQLAQAINACNVDAVIACYILEAITYDDYTMWKEHHPDGTVSQFVTQLHQLSNQLN